jgi:hypothetical protein
MTQAISGVGGAAADVSIERFTRVLSLQKQAMTESGQQTLKLIQSATLPQGQGQRLDVKA